MDINFELDGKVFNYRVACIIRKENKILVTEKLDSNSYSLIGGRTKIGENSIEAILREAKEETGYETKHIKSVGVIENFFKSRYNNKEYHEILIIHELEFTDKEIYNLETIKNVEGRETLRYVWKNLDELNKSDFEPQALIDYLKLNEFFHIINVD